VLARRGDFSSAAQEFEKALSDEAVGQHARMHWIETLFLAGDAGQAFREAQDACEWFPMTAEFQAALARLHQARGNMLAALRCYTRAIELEPQHPRFYLNVVEICRLQKDYAAALQWAERGLETDRDNPVLHEEKAAALDRLGRPEEAQSAREEAARNRDAEINYARALSARRRGDVVRSKRLLEECVALNPLLSKAWTELAGILIQERLYVEAQRAYLMAIEGDPENDEARIGLALALRAQGKAGEALSTLQHAISRGMKSPDLLTVLATAFLEQGRTQEAAAAMLRAVRDLPGDPDLLSYLGYVLELDNKQRAAQEAYAQAIRIDPDQSEALLARARYLMAKGDTADATDALCTLSDRAPDRLDVWHGLIEAYGRTGNARAAEQACRSCLARFPADRDCGEQLAYIKIAEGDFRSAAEQLDSLYRAGTVTKSTLDGLAFSLMKTGDYPRAIRLFETSLRHYEQDPWVYTNLGFLHRCRGEIGAAVKSYRRSRDLSPTDASRQHDLGFALYLARQYGAAVEPFQSALRLRPDWGLAHYDLAMNYWQMRRYALALTHARIAQERNVAGANRIVAALSARKYVMAVR
jgi:tetratricopeptide (TPR) repeat protein